MLRLIFLLVLLTPCLAQATYYWISPTGTKTVYTDCDTVTASPPANLTDHCNVSTGLASINTNAVAGDVVYFRGGDYTGIITAGINPANSGTCDPPGTPVADSCKIIYSAYTAGTWAEREVPVLKAAAVTNDIEAVNIASTNPATPLSYIKVSGIVFENWGRWGSLYNSSHHNEVSYCEFYNTVLGGVGDSGHTPVSFTIGGYCWGGGTGYTCHSTHNWIHHNTFHDSGRAGMDE